jgi:hypothetical protein
MKSFREADQENSLKWVSTGKLESQLQTSSGEVLAKLIWKSHWSSLATGESANGSWTLKRAGFLRPRVTIRSEGMDANVAEMQVDWNGGGEVHFANGTPFQLSRKGFWNPGLGVFSASGEEILSVRPNLSDREGSVTITQVAIDNQTKSLLAILSWYVAILASEYDSGGYVGAIVAIIG